MDWLDSMVQHGQWQPQGDEDMADDDDFYEPGVNGAGDESSATVKDALPGAAPENSNMNLNGANFKSTSGVDPSPAFSLPPTMTPQTAEQRRLENQKRAEQLRARLIANRQNTPIRSNTPSNKIVPKAETPQENHVKQKMDGELASKEEQSAEQQSEPSSDFFGIEALLREGKEAADAKARAEDSAKVAADAPTDRLADSVMAPIQQEEQSVAQEQQQANDKQNPVAAPQPDQTRMATHLETEYYADLAIWLEVTGYHDIDYRNSKLRTYKERKALEEEAARIQEKLEKLKQTEQAEMEALRGSVHPVATPSRPPPILPPSMLAADEAKLSAKKSTPNGLKRAHSPEPMPVEKNPRLREHADNGIRIRGANDGPQERIPNNRGRADSFNDRRAVYPEARRPSFGDARGRLSRDPSLERRQAYYGREADGARARERYDPLYPPPRENAARGRMSFSAVNVQPQERLYRDGYGGAPRGIRDVDMGRGGVRYFMIKSWNADNVNTAMRDSLWSTQEKNERLLADAYRSSHAVVLCFSVNNSKAFQGYALMTSPPTPSLPKPAFCAKLNWPTSPAFTLSWLATTSVHFRHVGHIKNEMNLDPESGMPAAVLVGKDGQEIEPGAGRGLCEILDEVQAAGGGGGGGKKGKW